LARLVEKWQRNGERSVLFRNVPALVCDECDETVFAGDTVEQTARLLAPDSRAVPTEMITTFVYDLDQIGRVPPHEADRSSDMLTTMVPFLSANSSGGMRPLIQVGSAVA
jgi:YgiT-type zinc finger domain-containing protein